MKNKAHRAQYGKRIGVLLFIGTSLNFLKSKPLWSRGKYCWIQITCRSPKENFPPRYHFQWLMDPSMKCGPIYDQNGIILPQNLLNVKKKNLSWKIIGSENGAKQLFCSWVDTNDWKDWWVEETAPREILEKPYWPLTVWEPVKFTVLYKWTNMVLTTWGSTNKIVL